jgi:hypothetical protein
MRFEEKFENPEYGEENEGGLVRNWTQKSCCVCGQLTGFYDVDMLDYFCSEECWNQWLGERLDSNEFEE